jgi:hypothetical protein
MSTLWQDRALPVLEALHKRDSELAAAGILFLGGGEDDGLGLDLSSETIHQTIHQLVDAGYVEHGEVSYYHPSGVTFIDLRITGCGLQVLGEWPCFEAIMSPTTLAELVERLASYAPAEEANDVRRAAGVVGGMTRTAVFDVALGLGKAWVRQRLGLPAGL